MANPIVPAASTTRPHQPTPRAVRQTATIRQHRAVHQEVTVTETAAIIDFDSSTLRPDPEAETESQRVRAELTAPVETKSVRWLASMVLAWWVTLLMGPVFAVMAMIGLIHPHAARLIVTGAVTVGLGASVVALTLIGDAFEAVNQ